MGEAAVAHRPAQAAGRPQNDPFALLIEDLHWADPSTLELLELLAARGTRVPVVGTWRLHDDTTARANAEWFGRVVRMPDVHVLELAALTQEETGEQLGMLGRDAGRVDAIYARTLGQPLFTEQLVADSSGEQVPAYLADLLDRRLGEVDDAAWVVARTLGVADRPIPVVLLAAAADLARDDLTAGLHVLADRHLSTTPTTTTSRSATPSSPRPSVAGSSPGEGRPTHRGIALALAADDSSEPAEVASHWRAGGDTSGELPWQVRAACAAARRFADDQAADHGSGRWRSGRRARSSTR